MLFCSQAFLLFFFVVFTLYWAMPWQRARVWLLLAASFYFYASWNHWLALLIAVSTVIDYFLARGIDAWTAPRGRRFLLILNLVGNLGLLCYFKYANFFLHSVEEGLRAAGAAAALPVLQVILPVGISFYTFEAINYMVDVYRRKVPAERDLGHFMLFITFFPHLVAGPIVRARDFLPQIRRPKRWDWARLQLGIEYFLMGLFKKLVIADRMVSFVDPIFDSPGVYQTSEIWIAVFAYALQIYGDFSGYTDMAIGAAHMLGYKLAPNFNMPYLACNIAEFWRRWHISLSSWLRDYLFIPLVGSRGGPWHTARNLMITMTLGGLWHGANWNFVLWGLVHGLLLVGHRLYRAGVSRIPLLEQALRSRPGTAAGVALTFVTVCCTWVLFRATSLDAIGILFQRMLIPSAGLQANVAPHASLLYIYLVVGLCHWLACQKGFKRGTVRLPPQAIGLGYCAVLMLALLVAPRTGQAFIYFQF
jgi:alginate O-acetyltransferase complex protein AlgI